MHLTPHGYLSPHVSTINMETMGVRYLNIFEDTDLISQGKESWGVIFWLYGCAVPNTIRPQAQLDSCCSANELMRKIMYSSSLHGEC